MKTLSCARPASGMTPRPAAASAKPPRFGRRPTARLGYALPAFALAYFGMALLDVAIRQVAP